MHLTSAWLPRRSEVSTSGPLPNKPPPLSRLIILASPSNRQPTLHQLILDSLPSALPYLFIDRRDAPVKYLDVGQLQQVHAALNLVDERFRLGGSASHDEELFGGGCEDKLGVMDVGTRELVEALVYLLCC